MVAPISYAERARRAQTIRSPIAVPPPHPSLFPSSTVTSGADTTSNISNLAGSNTAPSSGVVSIPTPTAADETSTPSAVPAPSSSSPASSKGQQQQQQQPRPVANASAGQSTAARAPSPQLAAKALSIVAAHTAAGPTAAKPAAAVNVWSQRIERMAAARAAAAAVAAPAGHTPSTSSASMQVVNGKQNEDKTPVRSSGKDAPEQSQPPVAEAAAAAVTPRPSTTSSPTSSPPVPSVSVSNLGSAAAPVQPPPASSGEAQAKQLTARDLASADVWPEVGKSVLSVAASISADSLRPSEPTTNEEGADDTQDSNKAPKSNTKSKTKSKWVPIPAAELQAAADAAVAARKPNGPNGGHRKGNRSHHNSNNATDVNNTNANNSANNTPRSHSGRTSAAQSRSHSAQNSPRATRGRRLPVEERSSAQDASPSNQHPRPPSQLPHTAPYQHMPQSQYTPSPHYPTPGHTPPEPLGSYIVSGPSPYQQQPHPRHQSHPMQPALPPSPSAQTFQPSATPFYPQQPPTPADGAPYPPPPPGMYGPPMYPMYPPPGFAYGPWQHAAAPGPGYAYGPPPPQGPYVPQEYGERRPSMASVPSGPSPPAGPPPQPEVVVHDVDGTEVKGEIIPSVNASAAAREKMVFGSIQSPVEVNGHSPAGLNGVVAENGNVDAAEKTSTVDETADGAKTVTKDGKVKSGKAKSASDKDREAAREGGSPNQSRSLGDMQAAVPAVRASQSMQAETKWKFGTASSTPPVHTDRVLPPADEGQPELQQARGEVPVSPVHSTGLLHASQTMPVMPSTPLDVDVRPPFVGGLDPRGSTSFAHLPPPQAVREAPSMPLIDPDADLVVKDYGYGFGPASGSGYVPPPPQWREEGPNDLPPPAPEDMLGGVDVGPAQGYPPVRDPAYARGGHGSDGPVPSGRGGRRGGAYGPGSSGRGFSGGERGSYGGRRGRGANGFSSRGFGRGFSRGGGGGGGGVSAPHRAPPFSVTSPQHMIPLSPLSEQVPGGGFYPAPRQMPPFVAPPNGFDRFVPPPPPALPPPANSAPVPHISPPVPVPLSPISFPLDPTRYYLLGQLEYYLSPQNMAQDFFLRKQMDSRGWIAVSLIASFNRVKQLTMDAQLVRDVLTLSSLVQVRGNMVRMGNWERYVLPDAAPSNVEDQPLPPAYQNMGPYQDRVGGEQQLPPQAYPQNYQAHPIEQQQQPLHNGAHANTNAAAAASWPAGEQPGPEAHAGLSPHINGHSANVVAEHHGDHEHDDEDDEEEEVVFVMGQDVGHWSPERVA